MAISFNTIPAVIRTPGQFIEFDSSRAVQGLSVMPNVALIIGPRLISAGTVAGNVLTSVASSAKAETYWGHGSIIAGMVEKFKAANPYVELWGIGVEVDSGGAPAAGAFPFTGTATAAGEVVAYIAGERIAVSVAINDTAAVVATALYNAVVAYCSSHNLPVVATNGTAGTTTITALSKGVLGNAIDLRLNYQVGESLPAGIACTVTAMTAGTLSPSIATAIAAMGAQRFDTIVCAFSDDTNMDLLEADLDTRWGPMVMQDGMCFIAANGTSGALTTLGNARNSKFTTFLGGGLSPTPPWIWAAVAAAVDSGEPDPARPRQTLSLVGCKPPARGAEFTWLERNTLLSDGISTYTVTPSGDCLIERLITTYQLSPAGASDTSYLNLETMRTLAYLRYSWRAWVALRYPRYKLADDGTNFGPGQAIVTPSILRSEGIAWFKEMITAGLAEGLEQFKTDAIFERNSTDPDRVDMRMSPNLMNQFRVLAGQIQFLL
jgi:phage tail sheath gpL-like